MTKLIFIIIELENSGYKLFTNTNEIQEFEIDN